MEYTSSNTRSINHIIVFLLVLVFNSISVNANQPGPLFRSDKVINIELRSDFFNIMNDRTENPEYHDSELTYFTPDRKAVTIKVRIISRGNFRRNPDICNLPPLFINFKKSDVKNTIFEDQDKLKLVTPCQDEEDLLEEYMIYKMYNKVTDRSLRARLVKVLYYDTGTDKKVFEKYSFFLEDADHAAKRNDAMVIDHSPSITDLDKENFKRMTVFQYLIGNIDWSIESGKNIIFMQPSDSNMAPYAVPYDFDFSAFVSAKYTIPRGLEEDILENRRRYRGICYSTFEFIAVFDLYYKLRPDFETIIMKMNPAPVRNKYQLIQYLDQFYAIIGDEEIFKKEFLARCKTVNVSPPGGN
jgi:hypothetical protein